MGIKSAGDFLSRVDLNAARQKVEVARAALVADEAEIAEGQALITALQAQITELRQRQEAKGLRATLAFAERALIVAEEAAVAQLNIELAGEIVRRQATDPVGSQAWIIEAVMRLRASVRSELDTPNNEKYRVPPLITQALSLLPPPDSIDRAVYELGYIKPGETDWTTRRRAILAAAESAPLEAA
jgi:multidrug efflux pump subunit AcrA (membrane-fusion protein)